MRLLPRSAKATWLLAGVVWVGLCVLVWWGLPVRPRAAWRLPERGVLFGFLPGSNLLITANRRSDPPPPSAARILFGPIRLWDAESGRLVSEFAGPTDHFNSATLSRTGRWLAMARNLYDAGSVEGKVPADSPALWLLDLTDGRLTTSPAFRAQYVSSCVFGPEDRWLICNVNGYAERVSIPGLATAGEPRAHWFRYALAPGGRVLANRGDAEAGEPNGIIIRDADTFAVRAVVPRPDMGIDALALDSGGTVLTAEFSSKGRNPEVRCWDVGTGRELLRVPTPFFSLDPDGQSLLTQPYEDTVTGWTVWDVQTASVRFLVSPPPGATTYTVAMVSPDGRIGGIYVGWPPGYPWAGWAKRLGLIWPWADEPRRHATALFDLATGESLGVIPDAMNPSNWLADSKRVAALDEDFLNVRIWEVPPRKPPTWFAVAAAVLALSLAGLAWWHGRRLRRKGGIVSGPGI
jgi:WD40 repeat protein